MRQVHIAVIAGVVCAIAAPVVAADLPRKAPVMAPAPAVAVYNWSGFYLGGHVGGAWGEDATTIVTAPGLLAPGTLITIKPSGFIAGAQAGVNYQVGTWVFGAEFDWSWSDANDVVLTPTLVPGVSARATTDINWFATATGRLGFAANNVLFYAKGGAAFMDVDYTAAGVTTAGGVVVLGPALVNDNRLGWTVGGGVEFGFAPNWSAKVEYNYLDFGRDQYTFIAPGATATTNADTQIHVVKGGINYRFNWGR